VEERREGAGVWEAAAGTGEGGGGGGGGGGGRNPVHRRRTPLRGSDMRRGGGDTAFNHPARTRRPLTCLSEKQEPRTDVRSASRTRRGAKIAICQGAPTPPTPTTPPPPHPSNTHSQAPTQPETETHEWGRPAGSHPVRRNGGAGTGAPPTTRPTYVQAAAEFPLPTHLDINALIQRQANQVDGVQRLRHAGRHTGTAVDGDGRGRAGRRGEQGVGRDRGGPLPMYRGREKTFE